MQSENWISNWNLKTQKNPNTSKKIEKNPKFFFSLFDGLWGLKSSGIARAFIFCDKTSRFLAILAFLHRGRYFFFQLFCYFTQSMACDSSNRSELRGRSSRTIKFHDFWLFPIFTQMALIYFFLQNSFFLLFFLFLVKRTIKLVIFFFNFQGFTLLPWQKVGRIFQKNTCFPSFLKFTLFVC